MITFRDVTVRYPASERDAVTNVSLVAPNGQLTAIVGPNGSGKSTLVRVLLGRVPARAGEVLIGSDVVSTLTPTDLARRVAIVVQREEPAFPMRVREFVALGRFPHVGLWRPLSAADQRAIDHGLEVAEVADLADRATDTLSGGEWQRVRLARMIAQDAPAVALDEPTTFLDVAHEMGLFELLAGLARAGRTVLVVSHQLNLVARFASRVILLDRGHVAADGTVDEVMRGAVLERVYGWPIVVSRDPAVGAPTLVPLRTLPRVRE